MQKKVICLFVLLTVMFLPFMASAETSAFQGLRSQLKACRKVVLEGVDKADCGKMLARVKIMNKYIGKLFKQAKLDGEGNYVAALQRSVELFRFQCALYDDGITDTGVVSSFGSLLKTFVKYKDFREENGLK